MTNPVRKGRLKTEQNHDRCNEWPPWNHSGLVLPSLTSFYGNGETKFLKKLKGDWVLKQPGYKEQYGCSINRGVILSSSRKAVNRSSARTMNRFPSQRCASAIQIVRIHRSLDASEGRGGSVSRFGFR
jgi:hypothetical protein